MTTLELEARLDNLLSTAQEETKDIDLFAPIQEREECPICMIPLPIKEEDIIFMSTCCGKNICHGCFYKTCITEVEKNGNIIKQKCAFCCLPMKSQTPRVLSKSLKKLMNNNNPIAYMSMAEAYARGDGVMQSDTKSLEMRIRAAELGEAEAYYMIGVYYKEGIVVGQDQSKMLAYYEVSAKKESIPAHIYLARFHGRNGDMQLCIKHLRVAAGAGDKEAMDTMMGFYKAKELSKEDLTKTLRAFQASIDGMKSKDRDDAKALQDQKDREEKGMASIR